MERLGRALDGLQETFVFKSENGAVCFSVPSVADIAIDVCTPDQIQSMSIALISLLEAIADADAMAAVVAADLSARLGLLDGDEKQISLWNTAYNLAKGTRTEEVVINSIREAGYSVVDVLGDDSLHCSRRWKFRMCH